MANVSMSLVVFLGSVLALASTGAVDANDSEDFGPALQRQIDNANAETGRSSGAVQAGQHRGLGRRRSSAGSAPEVVQSDRSSTAQDSRRQSAEQNTTTITERPTVARPPRTEAAPIVPAYLLEKIDGWRSLSPEDRAQAQIFFDYDSSYLDRVSNHAILSIMCEKMRSNPSIRFDVVGHTDAAGSRKYNLRLSGERAKSVKRYLVDECQISPSQIEALGFGEEVLDERFKPTDDEQRRVEVRVIAS